MPFIFLCTIRYENYADNKSLKKCKKKERSNLRNNLIFHFQKMEKKKQNILDDYSLGKII